MTGTPSTNNSGQSSPDKGSTSKTSTASSKGSPVEKQPPGGNGRRRSIETLLSPIQETALDLTCPTVATVERAAAAKIYLETHFNELLSEPTPRAMRGNYIEGELYHSEGLAPADKEMIRREFYRVESEHLREMRVMKSKSIKALGMQASAARESDYEVLKILGKGSFGVVRLVKERADDVSGLHGARRKREVYAMKVIRKSDMLRSCQEGHLRAERDFLVASEGSRWCVLPPFPPSKFRLLMGASAQDRAPDFQLSRRHQPVSRDGVHAWGRLLGPPDP